MSKRSSPLGASSRSSAPGAAVALLCLLLAVSTATGAEGPGPGPLGAVPAGSSSAARLLLLVGPSDELRSRIDRNFAGELTLLETSLPRRARAPAPDDLADLLLSAALLDALEPTGAHLDEARRLLNLALARLAQAPEADLAMHAAVAFAWLRPRLPAEERAGTAQALLGLAQRLDGRARSLGPLEPQTPALEGAALLLARSLRGTPAAAPADALYRRSRDRWLSNLLPGLARVAGETGGLPGGAARGSLAAQAVTYVQQLLSLETGSDLFRRFPFSRRLPAFGRYLRLPGPEGFLPFDETPGRAATATDRRFVRVLPLLAARFRDAALQSEALRLRPQDPVRLWPYLVWFDPGLESAEEPVWPLGWCFEGLGVVSARTRWDEGAAVVALRAGPRLFAGQQDDPGGLLLYRRGWALAPAAGRAARERTRHNTFTFWDRRTRRLLVGTEAEVLFPTGPASQPASGARITAFETNPHFTYFAADLSAAYRGGLRRLFRQVLVAPDPEGEADVVIVCDLAEPGDGPRQPAVVFHWPTRPEWDDLDHVLTVTTDRSRTFCVLEAPLTAEVSTDRVEAPPGSMGLPRELFRTGIWAERPGPAELFLSVFCLTDASAQVLPVRVEWIAGAADRFEVQVDWPAQTCLVGFNADGSPGGFIYFEDARTDQVVVERNLADTVRLPEMPSGTRH